MSRIIAVAVATALVPTFASARGETPTNPREAVGEAVFEKLKGWLNGMSPAGAPETGRRPILAVLPPADARGRIPLFFAETSSYLEGEVISVLRRKLDSRVVVWGPEVLAGALRAQGVEPRGVKLDDEAAVRDLLDRIGADAAVIGRMDLPDVDALRDGTAPPFPLVFRGVSRDAAAPVPVAEVRTDQNVAAPPWDDGKLSKRFEVEFLVDGEAVGLKPHPALPPDIDNVFIVVLDPDSQVGPNRSASCAFRIRNLGGRGIGLKNPDDAKRLFGVVLTVDGYNAVMEKEGSGAASVFSKRAPENSWKYVLTGPGWLMNPNEAKRCGYDLVPAAGGVDHSTMVLKGFQDGPATVKQFMLTTNSDRWVAGTADAAVGWITVHVFAQRLPGDADVDKAFGTVAVAAGEQIAQKTFPVKVDWYQKPVESWRIYYTYAAGRGGDEAKAIADALPLAR